MATIRGTKLGEPLFGFNDEADSFYGMAGNDTIHARPDDLWVDGGSGNDTLDFSLYDVGETALGVDARLAGGVFGFWPDQDGAPSDWRGQISFVENLVGTKYNDALVGDARVNKLDGRAGNDWLIAWGSGDFLTGGDGADKFALNDAGKKTTVIDFDYAEGDRLFFNVAPDVQWIYGSGTDADGQRHGAWIGTYVDERGNTEKVYLLDVPADVRPTAEWIIDVA